MKPSTSQILSFSHFYPPSLAPVLASGGRSLSPINQRRPGKVGAGRPFPLRAVVLTRLCEQGWVLQRQIPHRGGWGPPVCLSPVPGRRLLRPVRLLALGKTPLRALTGSLADPTAYTRLSIASAGRGLPGAGGLLASLPGVSRGRAWSPELASFSSSASAELFLASRGAGRTAGSATRVNFCGSRMSRTEKEILWWVGAALAPPSCHASMPAARGPEAGGAGSGMATLGLAFVCGSAVALPPVGGSRRPSEAGEGCGKAGQGESRRGLRADWHSRGPGPATCRARSQQPRDCPAPHRAARLGRGSRGDPGARAGLESAAGSTRLHPTCRDSACSRASELPATRDSPNVNTGTRACALSTVHPPLHWGCKWRPGLITSRQRSERLLPSQ